MTEIDVDMAIYAITQAAAVLVAAARDTKTRGYVEANRQMLLEDIGQLSDVLAATQDPAKKAAPRPGGFVAARRRSSGNPHLRLPTSGAREGSRTNVG